MANNKLPFVTVLWDLESCFPSGLYASDAVAAVRRLATPHGNIKKIKGFWNPNQKAKQSGEMQPISDNQEYRNALQLQGVDLGFCGFLDGENVVKAMIVETLIDIIDMRFHAPPSIIIISRNSSFSYLCRLLQDRRFTVLLLESWDLAYNPANILDRLPSPISTSNTSGLSTASSASQEGIPQGSSSATPPQMVLMDDVSWAVNNMSPELVQRFSPLIEVLQSSMIQGENRITRANLGNLLTRRSPTVYIDAGVNSFKKYMDMAVEQGVVNVGGGGTGQWVELKTDETAIMPSN